MFGSALIGVTFSSSAAASRAFGTGRRSPPDVDDVLKNNEKWRASKGTEFFEKLGQVHKPSYMYIGCADARVQPNEVFGLGAGEVFVHRNVANLVVSTDLNLLSALTYSVNVLGIEHILLCGHYECGGVNAAMTNADHGIIEPWVRNIRDVYFQHRVELEAIEDQHQRHCRLVELNVIEQCLNLLKTGVVQRKRLDSAKEMRRAQKEGGSDRPFVVPRIHPLVFDPKTGLVKKLDVKLKDHTSRIYDLYDDDE